MKFKIVHHTHYDYQEPVTLCHNELRLSPQSTDSQQVLSYSLEVEPFASELRERKDFFGNITHFLSLQQTHKHLKISSIAEVETFILPHSISTPSSMSWEESIEFLEQKNGELLNIRQFILDSPLIGASKELYDYAKKSFPAKRPLFEAVVELMQRIYKDFKFVAGYTTIATPLSEVFKAKKGVCQDFAQIAIGCLRSMRIPARYVSGYIETIAPPGKERLQGADASHAWFSAYIPPIGWVDFDPTNNQIPKEQHITVAYGRDYSDVPPVKGVVITSGGHTLTISVDVERM
jgi:transglutaminase-like putative cysteine protease